MNNGLIVSVSPHYHKQGATTQRVMRDVLIALIPALIASVIIFGFRSLLLVAVSAANCVLLEFVWNKLFKKEQTIADLSAVVTGVLIAYNVPVTMPIWQLLIGDFIAVIIVKMLFGGLGCNFVNPALVGRLAMMLSFTESMTDYLHTVTAPGVDLLAGATPLAASGLDMSSFMTLFLGNHGGVLGETCALALLIGGVYLVVRGVIKVTIPVCFIAGTFVFTVLFNGFDVTGAFLSLFSGGLLLGAFFMATDYVTSPLTTKGRDPRICQLRRGRFLRRAADEPAGALHQRGLPDKACGRCQGVMEKKNTFWTEMARPVVVLVVICLVASALLGFTNAKTAPVIEENIRIEAEKTRKEVLPAASEFTELEVSEELKANGVTGIFEGDNGTGYVVTAEKTGYGGAVVVTVGFDTEGKILSVKANVSTETQGVGSKVGEASMLEKFEGLSGDVSGVTLKTGATFTSNAVRDGVQAACAAIAAIQ